MSRTIQLSDEFARERGKTIIQLIEQDINDRQDAIRMREYIRNVYYGKKMRVKEDEGESDQHLHLLTEKIETFVTKEMNAFWSADPHVHAKRVPLEFDEEETAANERMVNHAVDVDIPKFYTTFESWLRNRHLDGAATVKPYYNQQDRNTVVIETADTMWYAGDLDFTTQKVPEDRIKLPLEVLGSKFAQVEVLNLYRGDVEVDALEEQTLEGLTAYINFVEENRQLSNIKVEFYPCEEINTVYLYIYRPVRYKDNVEVDLVEFEDLVVPFRAKDLQTAERLAQKYWMTYDEVAVSGWDLTLEDLELLKTHSTTSEDEQFPEDDRSLQQQKDQVTGQRESRQSPVRKRGSDAEQLEPYRSDKILIFEVYLREDLDQDGIWEEVIYTIPYALEKIVDAKYLEEVFPHGRRPFADLHSIPISNRYYSWSIGQILAPINVEVNAVINSVNKSQEIINDPWFFYIPSAFPGDPKGVIKLKKGQGIPIADPNGVIFPKFPQEPLANLQAGLDPLLLFADRVSVSPQAMGSTQVRNAPRTARGTLALLSEAGARIDSFIMAAQKGGWAELMYQIWALYDHYASDAKWEAVTGKKRRKHTTIDLMNQMKFVFKGNTVNTNKEVMRTIAQLRYTLARQDRLYEADPLAARALLKDLLQHFSEGSDIDRLLPEPSKFGAMRQPMSQETEIQIMLQGMPVDVLPIDDDTDHIRKIEEFRRHKEFDNLDQTIVTLLAFHERQHRDQLMLKQRQQQMEMAGQANNVPLAGTELSNMEGGIA